MIIGRRFAAYFAYWVFIVVVWENCFSLFDEGGKEQCDMMNFESGGDSIE